MMIRKSSAPKGAEWVQASAPKGAELVKGSMITRIAGAAVFTFWSLLAPTPALAESSGPVIERRAPAPSPEQEYNRGLRARAAKDWATAVAAFRKAVELRASFPEGWNELGYAFRNQGRYDESVRAYDEALRLRPNYPEALEYLGEAYVKMGRLDDARRIHERLKPLDAGRAQELAEVIQKGR
jgi:tetratricopeptide (TPR) repeat protein